MGSASINNNTSITNPPGMHGDCGIPLLLNEETDCSGRQQTDDEDFLVCYTMCNTNACKLQEQKSYLIQSNVASKKNYMDLNQIKCTCNPTPNIY